MNKKIAKLVFGFLLLVPFRLPISILLIKAFNYIAVLGGEPIPVNVLAWNVIITKMIYNLTVAIWFVYQIEIVSREKLDRNPKGNSNHIAGNYPPCYWWTFCLCVILLTFICFDAVSVYWIFYK